MEPAFAHVVKRLSPSLRALTEGLPPAFWALWAGTLITKAGTFVAPLMFIYLTQTRGISLSVAGTIAGLNGLGSLLGTSLGGVLADRIGRRITMLMSLVCGAATMLLLGFATEVWEIGPVAFLLGFTADAYRPASQALVADIISPEHRMRAFGLQYWAINLGFSFAAVVGGFMARRNFAALFVADALTTLALAVIVWRGVPESRPREHRAVEGSLLTPFFDLRFLPFLTLNFFIVLIFFQHLSGLPEDMRSKGFTTEHFGITVATNGVLIVLLQPFITRRMSRVSRPVQLSLAAALTGSGFALVAFAHSLPMFMLTVAIWTFGEIIFAPVNSSVVAELSPVHLRGRYQAAYNLTWSLGAMLAPVVGPRVIQTTSPRTLWFACLCLGWTTAGLYLLLGRLLPDTRKTSLSTG